METLDNNNNPNVLYSQPEDEILDIKTNVNNELSKLYFIVNFSPLNQPSPVEY